jgi:Protein of Unknown function (DUF2784)
MDGGTMPGGAMVYRALVPVIILAHFAFLAYVVFGGFLTWRWPPAFWPHLVATLWGVLLIAFSLNCPLTAAERWARRHAGQEVPVRGFIDRYVENVIYPAQWTNQVRLASAIIVVMSWLIGYLHWRGHQPPVAVF